MSIAGFKPRQRQASRTDRRNRSSRCEQCCPQCGHPFTRWDLNPAHQPKRVRELARAGLHPQAISMVTGWGLLAIERELARVPT